MSASVLTTIAGGVAEITLNRPEKRNALDRATIAALSSELQACAGNAAVRLVQITGAGGVFSAGADLTEMQAQVHAGEAANLADAEQLAAMLALLDSMPKPTLARVKSPFVLGKIGESAARRYFLTAETLTSATLEELGLVHEVVPAEMLDAACALITEALLKGAPRAQAEAKVLIRDVAHGNARNRAASSVDAAGRLARLRVQAEAQEGFSAFFAKRKAGWRQD